jgi:hypothetical protein
MRCLSPVQCDPMGGFQPNEKFPICEQSHAPEFPTPIPAAQFPAAQFPAAQFPAAQFPAAHRPANVVDGPSST